MRSDVIGTKPADFFTPSVRTERDRTNKLRASADYCRFWTGSRIQMPHQSLAVIHACYATSRRAAPYPGNAHRR
jgi:hypothetical protein